MKDNYTHVTFLLDKSSSMRGHRNENWDKVVSGYKEFIESQRNLEGAENDKCTFSLIAFSSAGSYKYVHRFEDIKTVSSRLKEIPEGMTALNDSIGKSILETGEELAAMDESERPSKVLFVIQTDGEENDSKEYTQETVKEAVEHQREVYNWQFQYLGSDLKVAEKAQDYGVLAIHTHSYHNGQAMTDGLRMFTSGARCAATTDAYVKAMDLSETDREAIKNGK